MADLILPLDPSQRHYGGYVEAMGRQYRISMACPQGLRGAVDVESFRCDPELSTLLSATGVWETLRARLAQAEDLEGFVAELTDVLEKVLRACPKQEPPPAEFYSRLVAEIDAIGWSHLVSMDSLLTSIQLREQDAAGREHVVAVSLPSDYPHTPPICSVDLPTNLDLRWSPGQSSLSTVLEQFRQALVPFLRLWKVLDDLDQQTWVLEPEKPSRSTTHRRIAVARHCSVMLKIDPKSPQDVPEVRFLGSQAIIGPLREAYERNLFQWNHALLVRANLEAALELKLPSPATTTKADYSADCGICYAYRLQPRAEGAGTANPEVLPEKGRRGTAQQEQAELSCAGRQEKRRVPSPIACATTPSVGGRTTPTNMSSASVFRSARDKMKSAAGMLAIDDEEAMLTSNQKQTPAIVTEVTGELTPSGSACEGEEEGNDSHDLTRTLSALQRLSLVDQTTLRSKLQGKQGRGSIAPEEQESSSGEEAEDVVVDSPIQVVLNKAVVESDLVGLTAALRSGGVPNDRDSKGHSPLHFAAAKGDIGCLHQLMQSGARANVANNVGWSPLHYATLGGHVAAVEALLKAGAYPCFRDNHMISPLHLASTQAGETETFRRIAELLGPSALVARDELQQTPLHVAASCGNRGAVAVLLDLNADPEAEDRKGRVAGQSFLRQVTRRARADIRASLAAAVEKRHAAAQAASQNDDLFADEFENESGRLPPRMGGMKRATSTASCESAEPVRRPSVMNLLQLGGWGGGGDSAGKNAAGETSFGGPKALASC
eukprot:g9915.t2